MSALTDVLSGVVGERVSAAFALLLVFHILAGLTCVVTGLVAITASKRRGRHPRFGTIYYWSLAVVFGSATGLAGIRWDHDAHLFVLGTVAFGFASVAYAARKIRWTGWIRFHIAGMSLSYIVLMTAFYVDNGPHLPLWNRLPTIAFWIGPSIIGLPLVARALIRAHPRDGGSACHGRRGSPDWAPAGDHRARIAVSAGRKPLVMRAMAGIWAGSKLLRREHRLGTCE